MSTDSNWPIPDGARVKIRRGSGDSLFGGREGTVIASASREWDVWVRFDTPVMGHYVYGFHERELELVATPGG